MKTVSAALFAGTVGCVFVQPVLAAEPATYSEKVVYSFCPQGYPCTDGQWPEASLIDVKGTLYGTTVLGGAYSDGTVFAVNADTGTETVLHSFGSGTDGALPESNVIDVKATLYGTTEEGGDEGCDGQGCGTVFSVDLDTGVETVLHNFGGGTDGAAPDAGLIDVKGTLYGTTFDGGTGCGGDGGCGIVFSIDADTGVETVLHTFGNGTDGAWPEAGLIAVKKKLYGTTRQGGFYGDGTIFSLDLKTAAEKVLYSFCSQFGCPDGAWPQASLIDVNGILYGTTAFGGVTGCGGNGIPGCGTVFAFDPNTGAENVLHSFENGTGGQYPDSLIAVRGTLYGTTGSTSGSGNVAFSVNTGTDVESVLYSFGGAALSGLIYAKHALYGTTMMGGAYDDGTVFALGK